MRVSFPHPKLPTGWGRRGQEAGGFFGAAAGSAGAALPASTMTAGSDRTSVSFGVTSDTWSLRSGDDGSEGGSAVAQATRNTWACSSFVLRSDLVRTVGRSEAVHHLFVRRPKPYPRPSCVGPMSLTKDWCVTRVASTSSPLGALHAGLGSGSTAGPACPWPARAVDAGEGVVVSAAGASQAGDPRLIGQEPSGVRGSIRGVEHAEAGIDEAARSRGVLPMPRGEAAGAASPISTSSSIAYCCRAALRARCRRAAMSMSPSTVVGGLGGSAVGVGGSPEAEEDAGDATLVL